MNKTFGKDQVVTIINSVIKRIEKDVAVPEPIYEELLELRHIIETLRAEIGASRPHEGLAHFPQAQDELDAVVSATETATNSIMDACENIQTETAKAAPEVQAAIDVHIMRIFEACSFQDITGQRIAKVTRSLKEIETKLQAILANFADDLPQHAERHQVAVSRTDDTRPDAHLLNGPQLNGHGISQADIDKLLEDF